MQRGTSPGHRGYDGIGTTGRIKAARPGGLCTPRTPGPMSTRDKNWLKLGGLATAAFALGLLFAGILDLPLRGEAQVQGPGRHGTPIIPVRAPAADASVRMLSDLSDAY